MKNENNIETYHEHMEFWDQMETINKIMKSEMEFRKHEKTK